ncbi:hypothetical protein NHQ30_002074 [Ciborinia camelliae]|nr:hypothetical protein NHQ30_002074 [Ciborinia camelliae]
MSSPKKTLSPDLERKASLRPRTPKVEAQEPPKSPSKAPELPTKAPTRETKKTVAFSPTDLAIEEPAIAVTAGPYRLILPKPNIAAVTGGPFKATATAFPSSSSSSAAPAKNINRNHTPSLIPNINTTSSTSSYALPAPSAIAKATTKKCTAAKNKQLATGAPPSIPPPRANSTTSNPDYKSKGKESAAEPFIHSQSSEMPSAKYNKRSRDQFEELEEELFKNSAGNYVILGGTDNDQIEYELSRGAFGTLLEFAPHFKTYLESHLSTTINITDFPGSSLKVLMQWIANDELMALNARKPGRRLGLADYPLVDTYTMADTFGLPDLCDEIMDSAMKELWGKDDEECILPDVRELYKVYSRTKPGNPLRKLYIAFFHWYLISEESNRLRSNSKPSSIELWDLLKSSGHAGVDFINYARSQFTYRGGSAHPIDPRKWNTCELHQHDVHKPCPSTEKRKATSA